MGVEYMADFDIFCAPLLGLQVSQIWQGYGSAIFVEFGALTPRRRRDGSEGNPIGEWTLMIEWTWRIEGKRLIWCGSSSVEERWPRAFRYLLGSTVASVSLFGRLPEIDIELANGVHIVSAMTAEGDPQWGLIHRRGEIIHCAGIRSGRLYFDEREDARRKLGYGG